MSLFTRLMGLVHSRSTGRSARPRSMSRWPRALPVLERLEDRTMLAVTVTDAANFVVTIDNNESVAISCVPGVNTVGVSVNGTPFAPPPQTPCANVTSLSVTATGAFPNTLDLAGVTTAAFTLTPTVSVKGGEGNDLITGSELADSLLGEVGDDTVIGGPGADTVLGAEGNDTVTGGAGNDVINGGAGSDRLSETGTNFTLTNASLSGLGEDSLAGIEEAVLTGDGADNTINASAFTLPATLIGAAGNDQIVGGTVADSLVGSDGNDTLSGGTGNDTLDAGAGADSLLGGGNDDFLTGGADNDTIDGGAGTDRLVETGASFTLTNSSLSGLGTDSLANIEEASLTGDGADNVIDASAFTGKTTLNGLAGNDTLQGGTDGDSIIGGADNDLVNGNADDDTLDGGAGTDSIFGADGNDLLTGGADNDTFNGAAGFDILVETGASFTLNDSSLTGAGVDTIVEIDAARLTGDGGNNVITAASFTKPTTLDGAAGNDTLVGGTGVDSLFGGPGTDSLDGGPGNDSLNGGGANDTLSGSAGGDRLDGSVGADTLDGGADNDTLIGGFGNDTENGGDGVDVVLETFDVNLTLTDNSLSGDLGVDSLLNIEGAVLTGGISLNTIDASAFTIGNVTLNGALGNDFVRGGSGNDSLLGNAGSDFMSGGAGNDTINGGDGSDRIVESSTELTLTNSSLTGLGVDVLLGINSAALTGTDANDVIDATLFGGPTTLSGGAGNDIIRGGVNRDTILGEAGNDQLSGGPGNDAIDGGAGTDRLVESRDVNMTLTNTALVGLGSDTLAGINEAFLTGGNSFNTLDASGFTNEVTLVGGGGGDLLKGGSGDDSLFGGDGNDQLNGGAGTDTLNGGNGTDTAINGEVLIGIP